MGCILQVQVNLKSRSARKDTTKIEDGLPGTSLAGSDKRSGN
jgi:hypothetical protein